MSPSLYPPPWVGGGSGSGCASAPQVQNGEGKAAISDFDFDPDFRPRLRVLSLGAGVQSSTMALMAAAGEIGPMPDCAIFADTQQEPRAVYDWLAWLEKQLPFPVHRVTAGDLWASATRVRTRKDGARSYIATGIPVYTVDGLRKVVVLLVATSGSW